MRTGVQHLSISGAQPWTSLDKRLAEIVAAISLTLALAAVVALAWRIENQKRLDAELAGALGLRGCGFGLKPDPDARHVGLAVPDARYVASLVRSGASVHVRGDSGHTALYYAATEGTVEVASDILARGASVNEEGAPEGTALAGAVVGGDAEMVRFLLSQGADPNLAFGNAGSALIHAAACGDSGMLKLLLAHGARVDQPDPDGACALDWARRSGSTAAIALVNSALKAQPANPDDRGRG
jgi:ankyrin repeat protein